jgi:hypothetical protein
MDRKSRLDEHILITPQAVAEPTRAGPAAPKAPVDPRAVGVHGNWQASSFDLAQGLDVKVMQSKLSTETLDRLFGS